MPNNCISIKRFVYVLQKEPMCWNFEIVYTRTITYSIVISLTCFYDLKWTILEVISLPPEFLSRTMLEYRYHQRNLVFIGSIFSRFGYICWILIYFISTNNLEKNYSFNFCFVIYRLVLNIPPVICRENSLLAATGKWMGRKRSPTNYYAI